MKQGLMVSFPLLELQRRESAPADVIDEWRRNYFLLVMAQHTMDERMLK